MVKVWAEKEMRNYRRIHAAGIPCPTPILLKSHILLMEFLGVNGWPSPRLKDAALQHKHMREAYVQTVLIMRHMYQRCKLVHGDLSEYNLLWHNQQIYVIDVSQSVETHHPAALDFLRKDSSNVNDFFAKIGRLNVMTTRQLFEFVTTPGSGDEVEELEQIMATVEASRVRLEQASDQTRREQSQQESVDEAVFMSSFLPRSLNQVAEYDIQQLENGQVEETYAHAVAALTGNQDVVDAYQSYKTGQGLGTAEEKKSVDNVELDQEEQGGGSEDDDEDSDDDEDADSDDDDDTVPFSKIPKTEEQLEQEKLERRAERKANKKTVRGDKTEKRLTKLKKKDKKKAIKRAKAGNRKAK